jgi:hypothetical protein
MGPGPAIVAQGAAQTVSRNPIPSIIVVIVILFAIFIFLNMVMGMFTGPVNSIVGAGENVLTQGLKTLGAYSPVGLVSKIKFGKIGNNIGNLFCFDENTMVVLKDGSTKKIIDVKIGDVLLNDSKVKGTMKFSGKNIKLINYDGILTTSNHHVLHDGKFKRVSEVPNVINNLDDKKIEYVYDLETTDHRIVCLNNKNERIVYTDYSEIDDEENFIEMYELSILNK